MPFPICAKSVLFHYQEKEIQTRTVMKIIRTLWCLRIIVIMGFGRLEWRIYKPSRNAKQVFRPELRKELGVAQTLESEDSETQRYELLQDLSGTPRNLRDSARMDFPGTIPRPAGLNQARAGAP